MKINARLAVAWVSVIIFSAFGIEMTAGEHPAGTILLFAWLLAVIFWSAFGVVHEAEELADQLGELRER